MTLFSTGILKVYGIDAPVFRITSTVPFSESSRNNAQEIRATCHRSMQLKIGNQQLLKKSRSVPNYSPNYSLATGRYLGEGFDLPALDTLFLTFPISWKGTLAQYAGRLHREHYGKIEVRIFDYVDVRIPVLQRMHEKRLKGYYSLGYTIADSKEREITPPNDSKNKNLNLSPDVIPHFLYCSTTQIQNT